MIKDIKESAKSCALVILNWNGKNLLQQFLPVLIENSCGATIYIADNASTDDSIEYVRKQFPQVKLISNEKNLGYAGGYNKALEHVEEDYYGLINSDIEVTTNWLYPILDVFESEPETAIVQPKILDYNNKNNFEYAGAAGGFIDQYGFPFCRGRIFNSVEKDLGQYDENINIFWASGACFFIRKKVFRELGGFDELFFAHQEEIDLCWRAFNNNYIVKYCYTSIVYHVGGATLKKSNPQKTYLNFRNSLFMLAKNLPEKHYKRRIFTRLLFDGIAGIVFLFSLELKHTAAILKAHRDFYRNIKKIQHENSAAKRPNYAFRKSIVVDYFILKRRTFKKLI